MTHGLHFGSLFIKDLLDPKPEEIDITAIIPRLRVVHRFSNNPNALTVYQHRELVALMASHGKIHPGHLHTEVVTWARHHDDHEAITGDMAGPMKSLLSEYTNVWSRVENGLDLAICASMGIQSPSGEVRRIVHMYDKMAETIEWQYVMMQPPESWNAALTSHFDTAFISKALKFVRSL